MTFTISTNSSSLVTLTGTADDPATILSSATLSAGIYESYLATPWTVTNAGHVLGAITLKSAGLLTNTGTISAGNAIYGHSAAITIANSGTILGSTGNAVRLYAGGSVTNQNGGTISANAGGGGVVINGATGTVVNAGTIAGPGSGSLRSDTGVWLLNGGSVTNQSTGTIKGFYGVYGGGFYNGAGAATTVVNAGNIDALSASGFAVKFAAGYADRVVLDPGAAFIGTVSGGNTIGAAAVSTLELASGASAGTLSGLGSEFVDFGHVSVDTLASWVLTGTNTVASGVTLTNAGSLSGAITLAAGGVLTNASTGTISLSGATPVTGLAGGISTIVNAGLLQGNIGISLSAGGSVSNQTGGIVSGATLGVYLQSGTLTNAGTISTTTGDALQWGSGAVAITNSGSILTGVGNALRLNAGGTVTNLSGGLISVTATNGGGGVVASGGVETVVNAGTILGAPSGTVRAASGVWLLNGGVVTNQSGGTIKGAYGVYGGVHTTVVNAGSIAALSASGFAVQFTAGYADRVVLDPGAAFTGTVSGRNTIGAAAVSTLELASGASAGTLSGLGTQFIDFGQVSLDTLASWVFTGTNTVASGVTFTDSGTLTNTGSLSGKLSLAAGGVLTNASTGTISLSSGSLITGLAGGVSTVVNAGTIAVSQTSAGFGIDLTAGGSVTNQSTGLIAGYVALYATGAAATVVNAGILSGGTTGNAGGIVLNDGGTITNQSTGTITGVNAIYSHNVAISLTNSGTILGGALNFSNGVRRQRHQPERRYHQRRL